MNNIKVSVIIPVYNVEKYLYECLESVVTQSLDAIEIICVDDGSSDGSWQILCRYAQKHSNIILKQQRNQGAGVARNLGLTIAKGEYIHFMDADDFYVNEYALERMYQAAIDNDALIVGAKYKYYRNETIVEMVEDGKCFEQEGFVDYQDFQGCFLHCRYLFNAHMLKSNGIMYPTYRRYEDPLFLVKALLKAGRFYALPQDVYVYRVGNRLKRYTIDMIIDVLGGIYDVLKLAKDNQLEILMNATIKELSESYECKAGIYYYISQGCGQIIELIYEINSLCEKEVISIENAKTIIDAAQKYGEELKRKCYNKQIIIYGAGTIGKKVDAILRRYGHSDILGYAVTGKNLNREMECNIKPIEEYLPIKKDALIIISTREDLQLKIEQHVNKLIKENDGVLQIDSEKIDIIDLIQCYEEAVL